VAGIPILVVSLGLDIALGFQAPQDAIRSAPFKPPEDQGYLANALAIMDRQTYEAYSVDPSAGTPARIGYSVSKAGSVRIRIVRSSDRSIVLRTLQDWTSSRYGLSYRVLWDGKDASGNTLDNK